MSSDRYAWATMSDKRLGKRLEEEIKRSKRALDKRDRAIAKSNVEVIIREQTRRFEKRWLT